MPITYGHCYFDSHGKPYATLEEAQAQSMEALFDGRPPAQTMGLSEIAHWIIENKAEVLAILSQKERQRVRAAKPSSRGVSKKRNGRASSLGATLPPSKESAADAPPLFGKDAA